MREGYGSRSVCVCVCICLSVTTLAAAYLVYTLKARCHRIFLWCFQGFCRVAFVENALFKSSGVTC